MVVNGSSSGSYGDASSTGRKSVCSMNDASSNHSGNGGSDNNSGKSTPCSFTEYSDSNLSEMENLNKKIRVLQARIERHEQSIHCLNRQEVRALFEKSDRDINSLTSEQFLSRR
jgi:TolA-binding protein